MLEPDEVDILKRWCVKNDVPLCDVNFEGDSPHEVLGKHATKFLRDRMVKAGGKTYVPARFLFEEVPDQPQMKVTDTETGRESIVSLYAYGQVMETLADLFPEE